MHDVILIIGDVIISILRYIYSSYSIYIRKFQLYTAIYELPSKMAMDHDKEILTFIFERVTKEFDHGSLNECDNINVIKDLCNARLLSEEQHQRITSCVTLSDKNRYIII